MNRGSEGYKEPRCDGPLRCIAPVPPFAPPHFQRVDCHTRVPRSRHLLHTVLVMTRQPRRAGSSSRHPLTHGGYHRPNASDKLTSFFAFSIWKKLVFILAAVCGPGTNGSLLPHPGCGAAAAAGEREVAPVTWQSGEEPAALPTGTSAGAPRSPPFIGPAALPVPQRREAGRPAPAVPPRSPRPAPAGRPPAAKAGSRPRASGAALRPGSHMAAARRDAAGALPAALLSATAFLRPCFSVSPLSSRLSPSPGGRLKNAAARRTHRQGLGLPLSRARQGARSDQNRSPMSLRPLLLQQKLNPGTRSCHPAVLRSSCRFPIPHSLRKTPAPGRLEVHGASRLLLPICSYLSPSPTRKR